MLRPCLCAPRRPRYTYSPAFRIVRRSTSSPSAPIAVADPPAAGVPTAPDSPRWPPFVRPDFVPETLPPGWRPVASQTPLRLLSTYRALSKERLSILMVLTAMAGYAICPGVTEAATNAASVGPMLPAPSLLGPLGASSVPHSPLVTLLSLAAGTYLLSASTNAINQIVEAPLDAQMPRTIGRPMPRRLISTLHASAFAATSGAAGLGTLYYLTSPLVAFLGFTNHVLYAFAYTPAKRRTTLNTPLGAVVGAIPPLMGWAAASGTLLEPSDAPGWALAGILFAWQYPHFNALAYSLRAQYAQAGYRMLASINERANARGALRGALGITLLSAAMPLSICPELFVTDTFLYTSLVLNCGLIYVAARFNLACHSSLPAGTAAAADEAVPEWGQSRTERERERTAKLLFYISLGHLPALLILMMLCKVGTWDDLQSALAALTGTEAPPRTPPAPPRGFLRRGVLNEAVPVEEDVDSLTGAEYVQIGGLAEADETLAGKAHPERLRLAPATLDAQAEPQDSSLTAWRQRATTERMV